MKKRNSNIEILRIISILFIVLSHYTAHNGVVNYSLPLGLNRFLLESVTLGNIGTILFVLVSGYFLINSKKVKISKLLKIWLQVEFYSVLIYLTFIFLGMESFSIKALIKSILPISFKEYWFATTYILMYVFHPYLNKLINSFNRKEHLLFIIVGIFIFSILHFVTTQDYYGNQLIQFFLFYNIGAYFAIYKKTIFSKFSLNFGLMIFSIIIILLSIVIFDIMGLKYAFFGKHSICLLNRTSPFAILLSVCIFNFFINKKPMHNLMINVISSGVFGVYLISDNNYMRQWLWKDFFENINYVSSNYLIIHMVLSVCIVFIACCLIDLLRVYIIDKLYDKFVSNKVDNIQNLFEDKLYNFLEVRGI